MQRNNRSLHVILECFLFWKYVQDRFFTGLVGCIYRRERHTPWCWSAPQEDGYCSGFYSSFVKLSDAFVTAEMEALKTCHSETRIKAECHRCEITVTPTPDRRLTLTLTAESDSRSHFTLSADPNCT